MDIVEIEAVHPLVLAVLADERAVRKHVEGLDQAQVRPKDLCLRVFLRKLCRPGAGAFEWIPQIGKLSRVFIISGTRGGEEGL